MSTERSVVCDKCKADGFWERHVARCAGCGQKIALCPECWPGYVACSDKCREAWRRQNQGVMQEFLTPPNKRFRTPKIWIPESTLPGF